MLSVQDIRYFAVILQFQEVWLQSPSLASLASHFAFHNIVGAFLSVCKKWTRKLYLAKADNLLGYGLFMLLLFFVISDKKPFPCRSDLFLFLLFQPGFHPFVIIFSSSLSPFVLTERGRGLEPLNPLPLPGHAPVLSHPVIPEVFQLSSQTETIFFFNFIQIMNIYEIKFIFS